MKKISTARGLSRAVDWLVKFPTQKRNLQQWLLLASVIMLAISTFVWSLTTAILHNNNADQTANTLMLDNPGASKLPAAHTFIFKLPVFLLAFLGGENAFSFIAITLPVSFATVGGLAYLLSKITRSPLMLAGLYAGLSSCLLYVPLQAVTGAQLPVNWAMLTTRNLEYLLMMAGVILACLHLKPTRKRVLDNLNLRHKYWLYSVLIFSLLFASDKLFMVLMLGASGVGMLVAFFGKNRYLRAYFTSISLSSISGIIGSYLIVLVAGFSLQVLGGGGIVDTPAANGGSPYSLRASGLIKGLAYSAKSVVTNFGADPFYGLGLNKQMISAAGERLFTVEIIGFLVNLAILCLCLYAVWMLIEKVWQLRFSQKKFTVYEVLALVLILATFVAAAAFSLSDHFFLVDARYLGICLFAGFVSLAVFFERKEVVKFVETRQKLVTSLSIILAVSVILGMLHVFNQFAQNREAMTTLIDRNQNIAATLDGQGETRVLVGDYWRVYPIKTRMANKSVKLLPMASCHQRRNILTNGEKINLHHTPFAYILSSESTAAGDSVCSSADAIKEFGAPNRSVIIDGDSTNPREVLLFYDHGITKNKRPSEEKQTAVLDPLKPVKLNEYLQTLPRCSKDNVLSVIAHQDDDLLFMTPDLLSEADADNCLRTVYMTTGGAGGDAAYWLGRQRGAEAAYAQMLEIPDHWKQQRVIISGQVATVSTPVTSSQVSLIFLNLPDGNIDGHGFEASGRQSLERLEAGVIPEMDTLDHLAKYNKQALISTLTEVFASYKPNIVRTQGTKNYPHVVIDHSDHLATGRLTAEAFNQYKAVNPDAQILHYRGYNVKNLPVNVTGDVLARKLEVFLHYSKYDDATCNSLENCDKNGIYGTYLRRQYLEN